MSTDTMPDGEIVEHEDQLPMVNPRTPEELLALAINRGLPVESMERLMVMGREIRQERARAAFIDAMSHFQADCPVIAKTRIVLNKDRTERYRYAALEDIKDTIGPILEANGLSYSFDTHVAEGIMTVICKIQHRQGHSDESKFGIPLGSSQFMSPQQNFASTLTYAKRYALCNSLGLVIGDEDNDASPLPKTQEDNHQKPTEPAKDNVGKPQEPKKPLSLTEKAEWFRREGIPSGKSKEYLDATADKIRSAGFSEDIRNELLDMLDARATEIGLGPKQETSPLADPKAAETAKPSIPF
jgi:hypothetical protein